jgi:CRP/FNR family cyclic AMP-dependent transcriptional regulator
MDVLVRTLSEFALFADLDRVVLQEIAGYVNEHNYEAGQIITLEGEPCQGVYLIVQGIVSTRRLSVSGREYVLDYLGPGEWFNLVPVLDGGKSLATTEALSRVVLYVIPCPRLTYIVHTYPPAAAAALTHLAHRVRYLSDTVEDLALHTVRTRLARFLLSRADDTRPDTRRWTQEEIAAHIGTVRDVVGRTLRHFAREGLIRRENGRLVVANRDKLEAEAMQE